MFRTARRFVVACLIAAFTIVPWSRAFANERETVQTTQQTPSPVRLASLAQGRLGDATVWHSALALVPTESRLMRQSVATTNESKMLLGLVAGSAIVAGLAMVAYGATSSCKGSFGNTTRTCDRLMVMGAAGIGAGTTTLALWRLSR